MTLLAPPAGVDTEQPALPTRDLPASPYAFPSWPFLVLAAPILLRAAIFATALITEAWTSDADRIIPAWAQILQASFFALLAFVLLFYGRGDRRAWSLGLFILDSASTLVEPFVRVVADPSALTTLGLRIRTDAFQAALVWFFASEFPKRSRNRRLARAFTVATGVSLALGVFLAAMDAYAVTSSAVPPINPVLALAIRVRRANPAADWYFTPQFLLVAPLLLLQPWKLREWGADDRRRFVWLVAGVAAGFAPLIAVALLATLSPRSIEILRPHWHLVGGVIIIALTLVPVSAAYAALVQRTLDLRLVIRAALQYLLARSVIRAITALPLAGLGALVFLNRQRPVGALVTGSGGIVLAALAAAGAGGMIARKRLLASLDRVFFRQQLDARSTLLQLVESARRASTLSGLCEATAAAVAIAFHPRHSCTFVAASDDAFHAQDADLQALPRSSALAQLVEGGDTPFVVGEGPGAVVARLNIHERAWLAATRARLLVPLCGASGQLLGIMVLGEKRSELPYTAEDRTLLAAAGSACGLALDRVLAVERQGATPTPNSLDLNPPARECVDCGTVLDADAQVCDCGGLVRRAPVPYILDDRLRFVQRVGAGGMGVVYRVMDLRLGQVRAVKTLAGTDPAMIARLRREARAMAVATHVNLATLHGLEIWRGSPMLVMEFLDGGTLAKRLKRAPLPVDQTLALGAALAQAVGVLHATGTLHRDIKPSNIGFTSDGVPKLLDFGLAKLLTRPVLAAGAHATDDTTKSMSYSTEVGGIPGTPSYLSPEVLSGAIPSPADDLWSLAVTLLEACTGANPFKAPSMAATVARVLTDPDSAVRAAADLPDPVRRLFANLLGPRDQRPDTAYELVRRLKREQVGG